MPLSNDDSTATDVLYSCSRCEGQLIPTQVETQLFVRRRGDTTGDTWSMTHLEAWTCLDCGRTDLYASEPERLVA